MLLVAFSSVLVGEELKTVKGFGIGKVHVDASALLGELGYNEIDSSNVPSKLKVQIVRSYNAKAERLENGDYFIEITANSPLKDVNLIGSNRTVPYDLDLDNPPNTADLSHSKYDGAKLLDSSERACLVFAIWNYPGSLIDIPDAEEEFDNLAYWISSTCAYDYWNFLTNSEATQYYIWAWITWACAEYDSVDVYWNGHGTEIWQESAFVSYDAWNDNEGLIVDNLYFADDFSSGYYDYSTLRVGSASFCYGWGFHGTFLNPGGSVSHNRAFMGSDTEIALEYTIVYIDTWGEHWYDEYEGSYWSHLQARAAAAPYLEENQHHFSYDDNSGSIWFQ